MSPQISIIIPTYNHLEDCLRPCCESIIEYTNLDENIEILIVANGCTDNTIEYISSLSQKFPSFKLLNFKDPLGYTQAINEGLKNAKGEYIVLLNNDTKLLRQNKNFWLNTLKEPFINDDLIGVTGPIKTISIAANDEFLIFFCVMISRKCFESVGFLREEFNPGGGEDIDFCIRAKKYGFKLAQVPKGLTHVEGKNIIGDFPIYHQAEATVNEIPNWKQIFEDHTNILRKLYDIPLNKMKIAVITPMHNNAKTIIRCMDSTIFPNIDLTHFIYDDASIDESIEIIQNYVTENPDYKYHLIEDKENKGQSHARNILIKKAIDLGFTHVAFLDADDIWSDNHLNICIETLINKKCDIVYSKPICHNGKEEVFPVNIPIPKQFIGKHLEHNNFIWISGVFAKISCFTQSQFDSNLDGLEDWDMWYRLYKQGVKFGPTQEKTFTYLVRSDGEAAKSHVKFKILKAKHGFNLDKLKLHVACGRDYKEGFINSDLYVNEMKKVDAIIDAKEIPYEDNSLDELWASHVIEHFDFNEGNKVLKEWYRVLKSGGKIFIETPDMLETCKAFVSADEDFRILLYGHFFAYPWEPGQTHKFLFTENQLRVQLGWAGFKKVDRVAPRSNYVMPSTYHLFLAVVAYK